jgi:hypothetical protein
MKRVLVTAIISLFALSVASPAPAAGPTTTALAKQIKGLQKTVKTLQKDVKTLKIQLGVAREDAELQATAALTYAACLTAVTADALQGTWTALDIRFGGPPVFGPQTPVNDFRTCEALRIARALTTQTRTTPDVSVFNSLLVLTQGA